MIVYKYLSHDRLDVLENAAIRFTQPAALNDPFETRPCFSEYREYLKESLLRKRVQRFGPASANVGVDLLELMIDAALAGIPKTLSQILVILSLSRVPNNLLMWAHYADRHRGFVMGFDSESDFFKPGGAKAVGGLRPVKYSKQRDVVPPGGLVFLDPEGMKAANETLLFTKSLDWNYEEEYRLLADPTGADSKIPGDDGHDICLFRFPREAVKELILGAQMSRSHRKQMAELAKEKFPAAKLMQATLNERYFAVDVRPVEASVL